MLVSFLLLENKMTNSEWKVFFEDAIKKISSNLDKKGAEYAPNGDRFQNFKTQARLKGTDVFDALVGNRVKHTASLEDMAKGLVPLTKSLIDEKCMDDICYGLLQWGLFYDAAGIQIHSAKDVSWHNNDEAPHGVS